jgi:hypothetical protein
MFILLLSIVCFIYQKVLINKKLQKFYFGSKCNVKKGEFKGLKCKDIDSND